MSAIATFTKLPVSALNGIVSDFANSLKLYGTSVVDYGWSGYVLATLLVYLDEQGVDLMGGPYKSLSEALSEATESTVLVLADEHKVRCLSLLADANHPLDRLRDYYNEFNESSEPAAGQWMLDGIRCIAQSLSTLDPESVVILEIG